MAAVAFGTIIPAIFISAIVLRTLTCYYFRFVMRRFAFFHPTHCNTKAYLCDTRGERGIWIHWPLSWIAQLFGKTFYWGDSKLFYYHKYFIWATVLLMPFHLYETLPLLWHNVTTMPFFTFEVLDIVLEMIYVFFGVAFILTCHSIKYFFDRTATKCGDCWLGHKTYEKFEQANHWHGAFLWLTIIFIHVRLVLLLTHGIPLGDALIMLFVRLNH